MKYDNLGRLMDASPLLTTINHYESLLISILLIMPHGDNIRTAGRHLGGCPAGRSFGTTHRRMDQHPGGEPGNQSEKSSLKWSH